MWCATCAGALQLASKHPLACAAHLANTAPCVNHLLAAYGPTPKRAQHAQHAQYFTSPPTQVRGEARNGDKSLPRAAWDPQRRIVWAATSNRTAVSYFAVHGWGNAYT